MQITILRGEMVALGFSAVNCGKTAVPIEMQFGILSWVGPEYHVLDGVGHWQIQLDHLCVVVMCI